MNENEHEGKNYENKDNNKEDTDKNLNKNENEEDAEEKNEDKKKGEYGDNKDMEMIGGLCAVMIIRMRTRMKMNMRKRTRRNMRTKMSRNTKRGRNRKMRMEMIGGLSAQQLMHPPILHQQMISYILEWTSVDE